MNGLKLLLIVVSYGYIVYKLLKYEDLEQLITHFEFLNPAKTIWLVAALLFMPLNWWLEALKWQLLVRKLYRINQKTAVRGVLTGITLGIFTPNRIGEIGGRPLVLPKEQRISGIIATSVGSMSQFLVTIIGGLVAGSLYFLLFPDVFQVLHKNYLILLAVLVQLLAVLLLLLYINTQTISQQLLQRPFWKKYSRYINFLSHYTRSELLKILMISTLRYIVFCSQFYFLLLFFGVQVTPLQAYLSIAVTFLASSLIPAITLAEIGIRGSVAIFFIGVFSNAVFGIVTASVMLWVVNVALTALAGSLFLFRLRII